jgi:hypothetical protein
VFDRTAIYLRLYPLNTIVILAVAHNILLHDCDQLVENIVFIELAIFLLKNCQYLIHLFAHMNRYYLRHNFSSIVKDTESNLISIILPDLVSTSHISYLQIPF